MKRIIFAILLVVLLAGGITLCVIGATGGELNNGKFPDTEKAFTERNVTYILDDDVKLIRLVVDTVSEKNIRIYTEGLGNAINIKGYENNKYRYNMTFENGVLRIKQKTPTFTFGFSFSTPDELTISVPSGFEFILEVNTVSSSVEVSGLELSQCNVQTVSGEVSFANVSAGGTEISTVSGAMEVDSLITDSLKVESTSGDLFFDKLTVNKLNVDTVSGEVRGTIVGNLSDYTTEYSTVSGQCNLPRQEGNTDKSVKLSTVSGNVTIKFES